MPSPSVPVVLFTVAGVFTAVAALAWYSAGTGPLLPVSLLAGAVLLVVAGIVNMSRSGRS